MCTQDYTMRQSGVSAVKQWDDLVKGIGHISIEEAKVELGKQIELY